MLSRADITRDAFKTVLVLANCVHYRRHRVDIEVYAPLSESEFISTLFHELKHAEQFCTGSLSEDMVTWKGRDFSESNAYWSLPWEISARNFEYRLLNRWYQVRGVEE